MVESSRADRHIFPASDRIDRSVFKILQSFTQRIFLRGIFGTCGADGIHKENVRFSARRSLCGSEGDNRSSGTRRTPASFSTR